MRDIGNFVVALHGFTGDESSWSRVEDRLEGVASESFRAFSLPGHGGEGAPPNGGFEDGLGRLKKTMRSRLPLFPRVHLVGYSLGARLALGLLFDDPHRFRSATLIGGRAGLDEEERVDRSVDDHDLAWRLETEGLEAFVDRWEQLPLFASQRELPDDLLREQRRVRLSHDPEGLAWALRNLGPGVMPDYRPRLADLEQPVHLMVGERDERFLGLAEDWLARVRGTPAEERVTLEVVPEAGHNLPLEAPEAVAGAVRRGYETLPEEPEPREHVDPFEGMSEEERKKEIERRKKDWPSLFGSHGLFDPHG